MKNKFKIRIARKEDKEKLQPFMLQLGHQENSVDNTEDYTYARLHSFLDAFIAYEQIVLIEDENNEIHMFGEIHSYNTSANQQNQCKELNFFPAKGNQNEEELMNWLYSEIEQKHKDVFSVEVQTTSKDLSTEWSKKGFLPTRPQYQEDFASKLQQFYWINPSFN